MAIQITKISDHFSTAPQISVDDIAKIAQLGVKTIINNRPDNEDGNQDAMAQPTSEQLKYAAELLGLTYVYIPVMPNNIQPAQVEEFSTAYALAVKPVLGFCRTGNRAGSIFKLAHATSQVAVAAKNLT